MDRAKRRLSLSRRLVAVVLTAVGTGMVVSATVSVWQQSMQFMDGRREVLQATAQAFSAAVASAASSRDPAGAYAAIRAIGNVPGILYAEVRTAEGVPLATLGSAPRLIGDADLDGSESVFALLTSQTVLVSAPIVQGGEPAGQLILIGGTEGLWGRLFGSVAITAFGGLMALIVGLAVGWRFQRGITQPLQRLIAATAQVREQHRYDITLEAAGDREVGQLIDGFNAMLGDIKERDARLDAHRRNLERDVADRTRDLREARDAAEAANRAKSDFLATMSHEIRTPMNGIMVMAELLAKEEMPPRQRRCADVIVNSGQSLLAIINDILDFSKIEAGKLELEALPVDVAQQADTTISLFAERARSKGLDLAAFVDPTVPRTITGDPVRLSQVIGNLVNNALKFTEHGFVHLSIGPVAGRPDRLAITVKDTGIGIPPEKLATIFDAFSQADQSTTRQYGGTGLGLAICKRLVTAWGGDITVTSTPGQGSAFTVTVPFEAAAAAAHAWPRLGLEPTPPLCMLDLKGDATFETASRYFGACGYTVDRARDGSFLDAALICVDAERLRMLAVDRGMERKPLVIAVVDFGDAQLDALVADGLADAVLTRPLLRADVEDLLGRIVAGGPLVSTGKRAAAQPSLQFPSLKVLVADDSEVNREVATAALTRLGASVHTVDSGAQAIAVAREAAFDIVLMDGSMPDIDGFAAARAIREEEERDGRQRLPIVALTAHVIGKAATAWREAGMDDIVYKPFTLAQLGACLQRLFPAWSEAASSEPASSAISSGKAGAEGEMLDARVLGELEEIAGSAGGGFLQRIFTLYLDHAPRISAELACAIEAGDADAAVRAAHALKSMSHNVGARKVAAAAEAIERHAYEAGMPVADDLEALTRLLGATLAAVRAKLEPEAQAAGLQLRHA
jgi:signal transduction histidine kinase/CheY-like chemotaxis protein/HPt (histidine-containing phosphotransfer) domain-containing protein